MYKYRLASIRSFGFSAGILLFLAACGGGGGGGTSAPPSTGSGGTPAPTGPTWTAGVFEPASVFKDQCEFPRSGTDIEGTPFPDQLGSLLEENFWLRSWTNETYLWNDEVTDRNPATFNDRLDYFAVLRTTAVTPSGEDKDDFHFSEPTEDFLARRNSAATADYGVQFVSFSSTPPRDFRVAYTDPGTPASELVNGLPRFRRGDQLLEVDGVDFVNGGNTDQELETINNGLFPANAGETHTFRVEDRNGVARTVTITSADLTSDPVNLINTIDTPTGRVGYMLFNTFSPFESEIEVASAISLLRALGVNDLVLDLRYNGGGLLAVASQLAYGIAGPSPTSGRTFERLQFNDDAGTRNPITGETNDPIPFYDQGLGFSLNAGSPLENLGLSRVFILTTEDTCSASEAVINGLRGIDIEVILIGDTTCGKPFGFFPQDNCGETYYTIQFQGVNDKGFGDYTDGFVAMNSSFAFGERLPGCFVRDDFSRDLGDTSEALLAAALQYREDQTCPAVVTTQSASARTGKRILKAGAESLQDVQSTRAVNTLINDNRDMRMPGE